MEARALRTSGTLAVGNPTEYSVRFPAVRLRGILNIGARVALVGTLVALAVTSLGTADSADGEKALLERAHLRVRTDGHLRPGHLERIRLTGFPGRGRVEVAFFPTAICEGFCGAETIEGNPTTARGSSTFAVRVPGIFFKAKKRVYFRDHEQIDLNVTWISQDEESFRSASARPRPIILRAGAAKSG